jgi:pyrrolidone-carboxylate peptidase
VNARAIIDAYRLGYEPAPVSAAVKAASIGAAYVTSYDPLAYRVDADGSQALVSIGVEPGTFFCGGLLRHLSDYEAMHPDVITGFIHVPPDLDSHVHAGADSPLATRARNLALIGKVVDESIALLGRHRAGLVVYLTGFGPFVGVQSNVTQEYVLSQRGAGRHGALLELAPYASRALAGQYYTGMDEVKAQFDAGLAAVRVVAGRSPDLILSLGVDSSQNDLAAGGVPRFKVESQTRGFSFAGFTERDFSQRPIPHTELATRWLERHAPK